MTDTMRYTDEELAVIDGVIDWLYPRMSAGSLRESYYTLHLHIQSGAVGFVDLKRIAMGYKPDDHELQGILPNPCATVYGLLASGRNAMDTVTCVM